MPASAVLIPTTRPAESASAPPEFPGLSAASVWITSSITRTCAPERAGSERPRALTTPAVTLPARPSGLPMATTSCPTRRCRRIAEPRRLEVAVLGHQHRQVGERIAAADAEAKLPAVGEVEPAAVTAGDNVRRGDQEAVGAQRHRRATPEWGARARWT